MRPAHAAGKDGRGALRRRERNLSGAHQTYKPTAMPRIAGQIDRTKYEAILEAASDVIFERGLSAPLDEIARRAGVSKQTIYNHYGSKVDLMRALIERRARSITDPLDVPGAEAFPERALAAYG
jgi:AcrR family transcriptional regulator